MLFFEDWAESEIVFTWNSHADVKKRKARTPMARMKRTFIAAAFEAGIGGCAERGHHPSQCCPTLTSISRRASARARPARRRVS
jgi:hypothetical protein